MMKGKNKKLKITLISTLCILVLLIAIGTGYIFIILNKTNKVDINLDNIGISSEVDEKLNSYSVENIALFGIDAPKGTHGRSDTIMIFTMDKKNNKIKLSSIMRDSYVDVSGYAKTKINHAYAYGGPELALNTINSNFDLNINKFITVNFSTLPKIIDKLGGITVDITDGDLKYINSPLNQLNSLNGTSSPNITKTGPQTLDGVQATAYSRIRYDGGDQKRTQRQRTVLNAIFSKMKNLSPTEIPGLLNELLPLVDTNINASDLVSIGKDVLYMNVNNIEQNRFPCDKHRKGEYINGVSYQTFNKTDMITDMHKFIFEN